MSVGQESADHHFSPCHHLGVWFDHGYFLLSWKDRIYWFFNGNVCLAALRYALGRFVPDRGEIVCSYIVRTNVPGFTRGQLRGEEVCELHIYVG